MEQIIGAASAKAVVKDVSTATFMQEVVDASHDVPVIVDFWAPWCGPCKTLGPMLEKAVAETKGAVRMVKVDIDKSPELAQQMRIQSIPAVYAFLGGRPVDGFMGAVPESQIKDFIKRLVAAAPGAQASPVEEALAQAKQALAEGDIGTASTFYGHILQHEPSNVDATAGMGRCYLAIGDLDKARAALASIPEESAKTADCQALRAGIELAELAEQTGPESELEARLARDPNDHQARFDLAMAKYAGGDRQAAVDHLLDLIRRNRAWNEEAARKQLLKLFEAFGMADPLTVESRRRLSTLLFS
jgi:putative thioredoxin